MRLVFSCGDNRNLGAGSKRLRAQTVTPCCLSPLPLLFPPLCSAFSSSSSPLCSFWRAEEMTRIHVPLHSILHLRLTAHGCQMSELKTNVEAVDDHELLWAPLQCCSACFFVFFIALTSAPFFSDFIFFTSASMCRGCMVWHWQSKEQVGWCCETLPCVLCPRYQFGPIQYECTLFTLPCYHWKLRLCVVALQLSRVCNRQGLQPSSLWNLTLFKMTKTH